MTLQPSQPSVQRHHEGNLSKGTHLVIITKNSILSVLNPLDSGTIRTIFISAVVLSTQTLA